MKKQSFLSKFYAIGGYYSTTTGTLGKTGQLNSYVKAAFISVYDNLIWIVIGLLALFLFSRIYLIAREQILLYKKIKEIDKSFAAELEKVNQKIELKNKNALRI